jgi:transcriptional regulator GlxA family with amidase domain
VRRATEILSANLDGDVPLKEVAKECRLSVSHFSRAFRRTMGTAPHQWLLTKRIEAAKGKLRDNKIPLSDVALACGFAGSKPPDAGVHSRSWPKSGRLASSRADE